MDHKGESENENHLFRIEQKKKIRVQGPRWYWEIPDFPAPENEQKKINFYTV